MLVSRLRRAVGLVASVVRRQPRFVRCDKPAVLGAVVVGRCELGSVTMDPTFEAGIDAPRGGPELPLDQLQGD